MKLNSEAYRMAQTAVAELMSSVLMVLLENYEESHEGLTNAELGRALGIYGGHAQGKHEGHVSRTLLGTMAEQGVIYQRPDTKRWHPNLDLVKAK